MIQSTHLFLTALLTVPLSAAVFLEFHASSFAVVLCGGSLHNHTIDPTEGLQSYSFVFSLRANCWKGHQETKLVNVDYGWGCWLVHGGLCTNVCKISIIKKIKRQSLKMIGPDQNTEWKSIQVQESRWPEIRSQLCHFPTVIGHDV